MKRALIIAALLLAMVAFGFGVNRYIAAHKSTAVGRAAKKPTQTRTTVALPGIIYVAQKGQIFALEGGNFTLLPLPTVGQWMQPHVLPDGSLLVVARNAQYSDLYRVSARGQILAQLTHDHVSDKYIQLDHWVFWPTASDDGSTIFASYDRPKAAPGASYEVDLAVWAGALDGTVPYAKQWTRPDAYTGGDINPMPLPDGSLLYVTYTIAANSHVVAELAWQKTPRSRTVILTSPEDDCGSATLAPDHVTVAMICTSDSQTAKLEIAHFRDGTLDTPTVIVDSCLCSSPAWASDGSGLLYLAPVDATGHFQLWWIGGMSGVTPAKPRAITSDIDLDATSAPAWSGIEAPPSPAHS